MKIRIENRKDFYAGLIFLFFGLFALLEGGRYAMGTAAKMGPGYFPVVLGILLSVLGAIVTIRSFTLKGGPVQAFVLRPLLLILGSVFVFSLMIDLLGLLLAASSLILVSSLASREIHFRELLLLVGLLVIMALGVFIYVLGLPLKVWVA
jgi:hypothetical protein